MEDLIINIENYIEHLKKRKYEENTIKNYKINLRYFYSFCKSFSIDFLNVKGSDMVKYTDAMYLYSSSTINLRLSSLRSFYEYLISIDLVYVNPVRQSLFIRKNRISPKPLSKKEEIILLDFLEEKEEHIKLAFLILLQTGIRVSELTKLRKDDFIEINKKHYVRVLESKNNASRIVPLNSNLYNLVKKYADENVFFGTIFDKSERNYQYHAEFFKKRYDIDFSIHTLRHTFATRMTQKNYNLQIIQKLLGHKSINTTMYYIEVSDQDILNL